MARILIVEDNNENLELIRFVLEAFGHAPLVATSGREGVDTALRERPELILMDLQMPGMDGFEALQQIRREPSLAATPIVAVTALAMVGDRERALRAGFDGYITKPNDPATFAPALDEFLPSSGRGTASGRV